MYLKQVSDLALVDHGFRDRALSTKRRHKKNMLESMDTIAYRPIYHIARFTKIKELKLRKLIRDKHNEIQALETCNHAKDSAQGIT